MIDCSGMPPIFYRSTRAQAPVAAQQTQTVQQSQLIAHTPGGLIHHSQPPLRALIRPDRAQAHPGACSRCATRVALLHQFATACHANIQIGDLFAQGIAVDAEQIGTFSLIARGRIKGNFDQRSLHFTQNRTTTEKLYTVLMCGT